MGHCRGLGEIWELLPSLGISNKLGLLSHWVVERELGLNRSSVGKGRVSGMQEFGELREVASETSQIPGALLFKYEVRGTDHVAEAALPVCFSAPASTVARASMG